MHNFDTSKMAVLTGGLLCRHWTRLTHGGSRGYHHQGRGHYPDGSVRGRSADRHCHGRPVTRQGFSSQPAGQRQTGGTTWISARIRALVSSHRSRPMRTNGSATTHSFIQVAANPDRMLLRLCPRKAVFCAYSQMQYNLGSSIFLP